MYFYLNFIVTSFNFVTATQSGKILNLSSCFFFTVLHKQKSILVVNIHRHFTFTFYLYNFHFQFFGTIVLRDNNVNYFANGNTLAFGIRNIQIIRIQFSTSLATDNVLNPFKPGVQLKVIHTISNF